MDSSTVRPRPNHYEALGLTPTASEQEIAQAFARHMGLFQARPVADAAQIGAAFETLRNPAKRRAYDEAMGFNRRPEPRQPTSLHFGMRIGPAPAPAVASEPLVVAETLPRPTPAPQPAPAAPPTKTVGSFIASSLREPPAPAIAEKPVTSAAPPAPAPKPAPTPQPRAAAPAIPAADIAERLSVYRAARERSLESDDVSIDWRRPALAVGALVLGVGFIGALAGLSVGKDEQRQQAQSDVTVALPKPKPATDAITPEPALDARAAGAFSAPPSRVAVPLRNAQVGREQNEAAPSPILADSQGAPSESVGLVAQDGPAAQEASAPAPAEAPAAQAVAASLPLPTKVIARTIEGIGYPCGAVASATSVGGGAGVYKVICTSGHSYQATPIHGHYRFRRLGSR
ncbi:MAG TPA: hypothetical protein VIV07_04000 [Sphingomicrobium sp.]